MGTPVASRMLPVTKYSARKTMVEKKSVPSLANTSFLVSFLAVSPNSVRLISSSRQRAGGSRVSRIFRPPVRWIPFGEINRAVAGSYPDAEPDPERQAGYIDRQQVRDQHQHERAGPCPCDDVVGAHETGHLERFGVDHF